MESKHSRNKLEFGSGLQSLDKIVNLVTSHLQERTRLHFNHYFDSNLSNFLKTDQKG